MCEGCEERIHVGHQVHRIDRSISKLLEMRVKEEGLDDCPDAWLDLTLSI